MSALRMLPPVHKLLANPGVAKLIETLGHQVVAEGVRDVVEGLRKEFVEGLRQEITLEEAADLVLGHISRHEVPGIRTVINATGIILHTNLGRSPLAKSAAKAAYEAGRGYLNLEMDLDSGKRSSRQTPLRKLITRLTGAESATVVNNCAAATILTLRVLAQGKEVILSRGQLIEIGGSFRMPDIMNASGAHLKEIGTTNITRIGDYEKAIGPNTGALMRVHTSNFKVVGFTKEASLAELVELGQKHNLPVIDDAGSGAIHDPSPYGLKGEPIPQEAIRLGAAVTLFSGDKLLGGPQSGIIAGQRSWIEKLEKDPFMRAFRCDKMTLAALEETLRIHLDPVRARREIPILAMLSTNVADLEIRAKALACLMTERGINAVAGADFAYVGGGTLPDERIPTWTIRIDPKANSINHRADDVAKRLRTGNPSVVARIDQGKVVIDPRTVFYKQEDLLIGALLKALGLGE